MSWLHRGSTGTPKTLVLSWHLLLTLLAVWCLCFGCDAPEGEADDAEVVPDIEVNLPPVPSLDTTRPIHHADGSYSIWGVAEQRDVLLDEVITVTGYVTEVYVCEHRNTQEQWDRSVMFREEPADGLTAPEERCNYPHLFIADDLVAERSLLITGYRAQVESLFQVGQQYVFEGRYQDETRGINQAGS